uniref:Flagellar hook-basal body complex protein FliE n=1 Tax=Fundidesulfovibrio putealis TaxID=270496 RepID=A0A7C4AFP4_9BACT
MAITPVALNAYRNALGQAQGVETKVGRSLGTPAPNTSFVDTLKNSLSEVNAQQVKKDQMVASFATGENQNVHELMIQLQKAGLAMSMTSTVRNKVMDMYKELVKMPF